MTRARRVDVDRMSVPHADISTAGVIIALSTASVAGASRLENQFMGEFYSER